MSMKKINCKVKNSAVEFVHDITPPTLAQVKKVAAEKYGVKESQITSVKMSSA